MATQIPRHFPGLSNRALLSPHRSGSQNYWNLTHVDIIEYYDVRTTDVAEPEAYPSSSSKKI